MICTPINVNAILCKTPSVNVIPLRILVVLNLINTIILSKSDFQSYQKILPLVKMYDLFLITDILTFCGKYLLTHYTS